jgi:2-oxoglutarate ferredoxin oxidoreductase subunit alpha
MVRTRAARIEAIDVPDLEVDDPDGTANVLVLGWGSTYGPIGAAVRRVRQAGGEVASAHLRHLHPFPENTGEILRSYERVIVPEMNLGQLSMLLRAKYLVDVMGFNKVQGLPFSVGELETAITDVIATVNAPKPRTRRNTGEI